MKTFLAAVMSVVVTVNVYANSHWIYITTDSDSVFFIDKNSMQKSGDSITFWRLSNFGKRTEYGDLSGKIQLTINCRTREIIARYLMTYDDINLTGQLTKSGAVKDSWMTISPDDSVNWDSLKYACK